MDSNEQIDAFIKALAEVQKQNELIIRDMIISFIKQSKL